MEILELLMKELKKKEIDEAVLSLSESNSRQVKFADNKIVKIGVEELRDINVFVVKDKKIITTDFKDIIGESGLEGGNDVLGLNKKQIQNFVTKLMTFMKTVQANLDFKGINDKLFKYKKVEGIYDTKVKDVDDVDLVEKGINGALKEARRTNGILEVHEVKHNILTSNKIEFKEKKSELYFSIRSFLGKEESGHENLVSTDVKGFDTEKAGMKSGQIAKDARNPVKGNKGKYDVIFSPLAFAPLLNNIGESASIFSVEAGMSFFTDKLNKKVGSSKINIFDDGKLTKGIGSGKADIEGVPTQKTVLIDKGVYRNYLHSVNTARKYNVESTGNAGILTPDPWNIVVKKGEVRLNEMIKSIKKGIYVTNVWYTRFANYHEGEFSTIPRDGCFLILNGKIVNSLKGIRVSENILNILNNVSDVGNNPVHLRSWEASIPVSSPHILVKNCNITTPTG